MSTGNKAQGTPPLVSIVIACRDRLPELEEAVASALAQDYTHFEVLVIDDGSAAPTRAWLDATSAAEPKLRVHHQPNRGVGAARAAGVAKARGELLCVLDSDDTLVPHALSRIVTVFSDDPGAVVVHSNILEIGRDARTRLVRYPHFASAHAMLRATLVRPRVPFKHSGTTYHRETIADLGSYRADLPIKVDVELYLRLLDAGHLPRLIDEPLVNFRMHEGSLSNDRRLGLSVWMGLIERYGPRRRLPRLLCKSARILAETSKQVYVLLQRQRAAPPGAPVQDARRDA